MSLDRVHVDGIARLASTENDEDHADLAEQVREEFLGLSTTCRGSRQTDAREEPAPG